MTVLQYLIPSSTGLLLVVSNISVLYLSALAIYRLYLSPLSHIPGPKWAAITYFYEFYWDVIQPGRLTWHLHDLHDQYGPVVRVTPDEVHIRDSSYFDEFYARSSTVKQNKLRRFSGRFGFKQDSFSSWQHDLHRMRRAAINPFLSVQKVTSLQPVLRSKLSKLTTALVKAAQSKDVVPINLAYMALTGDITTTYAFAKSYNQLDAPNFEATYDDALRAMYTLGNVTVHFPIIFTLVDISPPWLTRILNPVVMPIVEFYADRKREINEIRTGLNKDHELADNPTIFHEMLRAKVLPEHEKTDERLSHEAVEIVAAGVITTSFALTVGTYHISADTRIRQNLHDELRRHLEHPLNMTNLESNGRELDWHALELLPYLGACVRESIRLSGGVISRSPRVTLNEPVRYKSTTIPPGYAVSMTTWHVASDPAIFPDPEVFRPERWLTASDPSLSDGGGNEIRSWSRNVEMDRWIVAFGKGPRQCAGINLAFAELYVTLATMFRSFEFEVTDGTNWEDDVKISHAYMVPYPKMDSKGVRVLVKAIDD